MWSWCETQQVLAQQLWRDFLAWRTRRKIGDGEDSTLTSLAPYRSALHYVVVKAVDSHVFNAVIIVTILVNMVTIALETMTAYQSSDAESFFKGMSSAYLSIYTIEFVFKVFADPWGYWRNNYNRMDAIVLAISYTTDVILVADSASSDKGVNVSFLKLFRALRALRALRSISFIRQLQVLVSALIKTFAATTYLATLLVLLMFVWGMVGHYAFGRGPTAEDDHWGTIQYSMYNLWVLVTLDSWTNVAIYLSSKGFALSTIAAYMIPWIFVGGFIFTNLFIGVVVQNLEEAQEEEKVQREHSRNELFKKRKDYIIDKQRRDLEQLMMRQETNGKVSLDEFLKNLAGTLNHDDVAPMKTLLCSRIWFETYTESQVYYEEARNRLQRLHLETATRMHELLERRMQEMRSTELGYYATATT